MKKILKTTLLSSVAALTLASGAFARGAPMPAPCAPECAPACVSGFYAGAQGGWIHTYDKFKVELTAPGFSLSGHKKAHKNGVVGEIFVGWQRQFATCWTWGLELAGELDSAKTKKTFSSNGASVKLTSHRKWGIIP